MKQKNKIMWITITLVILLIVVGSWYFFSHYAITTQRSRPTVADSKSKKNNNKNNLTVKQITKDKKLLLAVIIKYANVQNDHKVLHGLSDEHKIKLNELDYGDQVSYYEVIGNDIVNTITVSKTNDKKNRVIFKNDSSDDIGVTLSSIVELINSKVSKGELLSTMKQIELQKDGEADSSSSSVKATSKQDINVTDLKRYLTNDMAMKALIYFGSHNEQAVDNWKGYANVSELPLQVSPVSVGKGVTIVAQQAGGINVTWPTIREPINSSNPTQELEFSNSSHDSYTVTYEEIADFVNDAGGKSAIDSVNFEMKSSEEFNPNEVNNNGDAMALAKQKYGDNDGDWEWTFLESESDDVMDPDYYEENGYFIKALSKSSQTMTRTAKSLNIYPDGTITEN